VGLPTFQVVVNSMKNKTLLITIAYELRLWAKFAPGRLQFVVMLSCFSFLLKLLKRHIKSRSCWSLKIEKKFLCQGLVPLVWCTHSFINGIGPFVSKTKKNLEVVVFYIHVHPILHHSWKTCCPIVHHSKS